MKAYLCMMKWHAEGGSQTMKCLQEMALREHKCGDESALVGG
jgi:hypothetical protein